jgi:Holliday junction resolvasome RuvABC endonuclease subunit
MLSNDVRTPVEFEAYEKATFTENNKKKLLKCPTCAREDGLTNQGVGGNSTQFGTRRIQVKCKHCSVKKRLEEVLFASGLNDLAAEVEKTHLDLPVQSGKRAQVPPSAKKIDSFFTKAGKQANKRVHLEVESEEETFEASTGPKNAASRATETADEISKMDQIIKENEILKKENAQLRAELQAVNLKLDKVLAKLEINTVSVDAPRNVQESPEITNAIVTQTALSITDFPTLNEANLAPKTAKKGTYAQAAKAKNKVKRMASTLLRAKQEPLEFERIHVKLNDKRALKKCKNIREVRALIKSMLMLLGVNQWVYDFSTIGHSIIELYARTDMIQQISEAFAAKKIEMIEDLDLTVAPEYSKIENVTSKVAKRLSWVYANAKFMNLKNAVLEGLSEEIQNEIIVLANNIRNKNEITNDLMDIQESPATVAGESY